MDRRQELVEINQQRKELIKRQKELLRELHENKGEQVEAKKVIAEKRKAALIQKTLLRTLLTKMKETLKSKESTEINGYIVLLDSACTALQKSLKDFSEAVAEHEEL